MDATLLTLGVQAPDAALTLNRVALGMTNSQTATTNRIDTKLEVHDDRFIP